MIQPVEIKKLFQTGEIPVEKADYLAVEEPLEISIAEGDAPTEIPVSITMRTPGNDAELAIGFLFTEGILQNLADLRAPYAIQQSENKVMVLLNPATRIDLQKLKRNFYTTSSCGVCGKESVEAIRQIRPASKISDSFRLPSRILYSLPQQLRAAQRNFETTGAIHAAALFDQQGRLIALREDVGRHNALDKLIGAAFLQSDNLPFSLSNCLLLLSGRASFELIQKAAMAGIPMVCALGAPSSLAVETAREFDITLVGFLKKETCNCYSGAARILA